MRRFPRLFPLLRRGSEGGASSCCSDAVDRSFVSSHLEARNWYSSSGSTSGRPLLLKNAPLFRFFGDDAASPSTSTSTTLPEPPPPPRDPRRGGRRSRSRSRASTSSSSFSSSSTTVATKKKKASKLDPAVLAAISHNQRNSVSPALALLADPPPHIPLEHLTLAGNSLISALGRCGRPHDALRALQRLAEIGAPFNSFTAAAAVSACARATSKVGTLPRPWAERGREIYRGYVEAAEAAEREEEKEREAEEVAGSKGGGRTATATTAVVEAARRTRQKKKKNGPIRSRALLRALIDCASRSNDPEAVWAALDEFDVAGLRPGPAELASLIHAHARKGGSGEEGGTDTLGGGGGRGAASEARAAASEFLGRYGDRWDPSCPDMVGRYGRAAPLRDGDSDESGSSSEEGDEEEQRRVRKKKRANSSSSSSSSETISMMTPAVYNALLRAHARAGDLDGAYAVRRAMISSRVPPDSGTCRALSECFGEDNIELAADLVEAADAERVEFLMSKGFTVSSPPSSSSSSSDAAASSPHRYRPRESMPFPPALASPSYLTQKEWSLFPVREADAAAVFACQGRSAAAPAAARLLPPPLVIDLHGMSRPAARVVLLVSLRKIVAAAADPGRSEEGVWGRLARRKRSGGADSNGSGAAAVPGGLVIIVGRSNLAAAASSAASASGATASTAKETPPEKNVRSERKRLRQRRRRRARALERGTGGCGGSEGDSDGSDDGDVDDDEASPFAEESSARAAARAANRAASLAVDGGINASVLSFATEHLGLPAALDPHNEGRVVVSAEDLDLWVLAELERRRRASTAELAGKQAAAVAVVASSAFGFLWVVPKLLAI